MIEDSWISQREPEPFDADDKGEIMARVSFADGYRTSDFHPQYVIPVYTVSVKEYKKNDRLVEWRHTQDWLDTHKEFDRAVDQISGSMDQGVVALAKDGTMWMLHSKKDGWGWRQLPELPKDLRKVKN